MQKLFKVLDELLAVIFIALFWGIVFSACVASGELPTVDPTPTREVSVVYLDTCLPNAEQDVNILVNPCFMGSTPYNLFNHSQQVPLTYRPVFVPGVWGAVGTDIWAESRGVFFDLTYYSGYAGLETTAQLSAGQAYYFILRGSSTIVTSNWEDTPGNFSVGGSILVGDQLTALRNQDIATEYVSEYGTPAYHTRGDREFIWVLFADTDLEVIIDFGPTVMQAIGLHGSTWWFKSASLIPVDWDGPMGELIVIRHPTG